MKNPRPKTAGSPGIEIPYVTSKHNIRLDRIEYRPIDDLRPYHRKLRKRSETSLEAIKVSLASFGFVLPVLIDPNGTIIGGEGLVEAARGLGYTEVPTVAIDHLGEPEVRALRIGLNRLAESAEWQTVELGIEFKELDTLDLSFSCEVTGFSAIEIDNLVQGEKPADEVADDPDDCIEPLSAGVSVSRPGDIWRMDKHSVFVGSSLEPSNLACLMGDDRAHMVFTDSPYNDRINGYVRGSGKHKHREFAQASGEMTEAEFIDFQSRSTSTLAANCRDGALLYLCMDHRHMWEMMSGIRAAGLKHVNLAVWVKPSGGMGSLYRAQHELIFVAQNGTAPSRNNVQLGRHGRNRTNCWFYPGINGFGREREELRAAHPTPKNVAMVTDAIRDVTVRGDIVLDGFLGSGTTLIAAERTGRICRGVELDPLYVDSSVRRWEKLTGHEAKLAATGETFAAVMTRRATGSNATQPELYARPRTRAAA